jgi:hypothetical protein
MRLAIFVALIALQSNALPAQDTVRVRADGPPVWGRDVKLVQELAIGQVDGPPEYAFGRIFFAAAEPGGAFYLFDGNDGQVRRYDARGRFTGLIGRKGSGPGEYQTVGNMAVDASGLLVVFDPASRRVTHFGPDGKMRREWSTTRSLWNDFHIDSAGRAIENQIYVVTAGIVGNLPSVAAMDIHYGRAAVYSPADFEFARDGIQAEADSNVEMLLVTDLDINDLYRSRSAGSVRPRHDRRPDLFEYRAKFEKPIELEEHSAPFDPVNDAEG